jgi:hypothetical protein
MSQLEMREKVIEELSKIPDEQMENIYEFIRHIRTEPQNSRANADKIMGFAGCWSDMPDNAFSEFIQEMGDRLVGWARPFCAHRSKRPTEHR